MYAKVNPWSSPPSMPGTGVPVTFTFGTFPQTHNYTDLGFDTQYQYQGDNFWVTLRGSYIYELQKLNASFANGISTNPSDVLNEARAYATLAYGNYNRVVLTGQYFTSWGTPDLGFEGGSPNTKGRIAKARLRGQINAGVARPGLAFPDSATFTENTDLLASVTGRLGYAWNNWLFYGKGGAAWAANRYSAFDVAQTYNFQGLEHGLAGPPARASNGHFRRIGRSSWNMTITASALAA